MQKRAVLLFCGALAVVIWLPSWRWFALAVAVPLALYLLISAAIRIHQLRHPDADDMDEQTEILEDLRQAAVWLFELLP